MMAVQETHSMVMSEGASPTGGDWLVTMAATGSRMLCPGAASSADWLTRVTSHAPPLFSARCA